MSSYEEMIKQIDQELSDIEYVEREAAKKGLQPGDYDLFSALSARKEDRQKEEADALEKANKKEQVIPNSTSTYTEDNGTLKVVQPESNEPLNPDAVTVKKSGTYVDVGDQNKPQGMTGSLYTNVDPAAYQLSLAQTGDKTTLTTDPDFMDKVIENMVSNNLTKSTEQLNTLAKTGSSKDQAEIVKGNINMSDPEAKKEIDSSPEIKAWIKANEKKFRNPPEEYMVVESQTSKYGNRNVRYIQPKLTDKYIQENYIIPELDFSLENPYLEQERQIRDDFKDRSIGEIEKLIGKKLDRLKR